MGKEIFLAMAAIAAMTAATFADESTNAKTSQATEGELIANLIVQNHVDDPQYTDKLLGLADYLAAELSTRGIRCVIPENAIGLGQNKRQSGEDLSGSSAKGQSQALDAGCFITASIRSFSANYRGVPPLQVVVPILRMTLNVADSVTAATIVGENITVTLPPLTLQEWEYNNEDAYQTLLETAATECADKIAAKIAARKIATQPKLVTVDFTCNVEGADIKIDGFSYGTVPVTANVQAGVHEVEVLYPFCVPYRTHAKLQDGQKFNVNLELSEEGRVRYQDMELFEEVIDRIKQSGATDDYVRRALADAESEFLRNSHFHWDGALQTLTIERDGAPPVVFGPTTVVK